MDKVADYYLTQWAQWRGAGHGVARGYQSRTPFDRLRWSHQRVVWGVRRRVDRVGVLLDE